MLNNLSKIDWKNTKFSTKIRFLSQILTLILTVVCFLLKNNITNSEILGWVALALFVIISLINMWFDNDFTKGAQIAGTVFDAIKDGKIDKSDIDKMMNNINDTSDADAARLDKTKEQEK